MIETLNQSNLESLIILVIDKRINEVLSDLFNTLYTISKEAYANVYVKDILRAACEIIKSREESE